MGGAESVGEWVVMKSMKGNENMVSGGMVTKTHGQAGDGEDVVGRDEGECMVW